MLFITSSILFISLGISFITPSSPLILGFWVLSISLSMSFLMALTFNSWYAIIIFLIYIGGMLVMFAYFSALTPNQPLNISISFLTMSISFLCLSLFTSLSFPTIPNPTPLTPSPLSPMTMLFTPLNSYLLLFLASALFLILVAIVKIMNTTMGPLRPFS
uniref:NADH dehydrogenase subunit 6 n=1 Tax=Pelagomacellicephala iliffei TaxID=1960706 RepID=A0A8E7IW68_9ANNE|nr:NADH dehydrogenase subunit 6 [Pelagomacellicephala iliffei]